jgi:uncharacterized protein with NRDE domain
VEAGNLPFVLAKALTAPHIVSAEYGTRCSTALTWSDQEKISVCERRFDVAGTASGDSRYSFAAT